MARLRVLAVSARLPAWAETACAEYARRMPKGYEVERMSVKREDRLQAVTFAEGHFIAAAKNGELINSADGKNWKAGAPATDLVSVR